MLTNFFVIREAESFRNSLQNDFPRFRLGDYLYTDTELVQSEVEYSGALIFIVRRPPTPESVEVRGE